MVKEYKQCKGITSKGVQCKLNAPEGYCHYHIAQRGKQNRINLSQVKVRSINRNEREIQAKTIWRRANPTTETEKNGYIYVYTLTRLLSNNDKNWSLKVRNLPNATSKQRDKWIPFKSEKSPYMLIKVGMTTQTVQRRLKQWQDKCHHNLTCLHPQRKIESSSSKIDLIIHRFKDLSIQKQQVKFRTYNVEEFGFQCHRGVNVAESEIHKILVEKYGSGDVYCTGCKATSAIEDNSKWKLFNKLYSKDPFQDGYNIHVEWFLIPKKDLERVYQLIDTICSKYYK